MSKPSPSPAYDTPAVRKLITRAKKGDQSAFTKLVRTYEDLVFRYAFKLCRDQEKAEEAFQDTFVNVYKRLDQFNGRSKFSSWLYTIVSNNCLMKLRQSKLAKASISLEQTSGYYDSQHVDENGHIVQTLPAWKDTPLDGVLRGELRKTLDEAISELPPAYRAVFLLRDIEERSAKETATILGISVAAVKSRLHRARGFLRDHMHPYMTK
jgi:RNA polymerase sigma-70 factor (ECF subfamily)